MITVYPQGGLGNKLRSIKSAILLAKSKSDNVVILWDRKNGVICPFKKLIKSISYANVEVIDFNGQSISIRACLKRGRLLQAVLQTIRSVQSKILIDRYIKKCDLYIKDVHRNDIDEYALDNFHNVFIESCDDFFGEEDYSIFEFSTSIVKKSVSIVGQYRKKDLFGVHIRRGDNKISIEHSPIDLFIKEIDDLLKVYSAFFLSTDDIEVRELLKERFPNRVVYYEDICLDRDSSRGQVDALVDMLCLAATDFIVGSYWSSFSLVASQIGKIESRVIYRK